MKKFISLIVILSFALSLCACNKIEKAEEAVTGFFTAITTDNKESIPQYLVQTGESESTENEETSSADMFNEFGQDFWNSFSKITYGIQSSEFDVNNKKKVNVVVEVKSVDLPSIYQNAVSEAIEAVFADIFNASDNVDISDDAFDRFAKKLSSEDVPMTSTTVTLSVIKTKEGWQIEADKELYDAVTGGFISYVEQLGDDGIGGY